MGFLDSLGSGLAGAVGGIASTFLSTRATEKENKRSRNYQDYWNNVQQANWQKEFDYQKYLNENQMRITSEDSAKAGINPIVGAGGNVSGFSGSISPDTQRGQVADYSGIADAFNALSQSMLANRQLNQQKELTDESLKNQKEIAEQQSETQKEVARINAEASKYGADSSATTSDKDRASRESIATAELELKKKLALMDDATKRKLANDSNELQKALQKASQDWEASDKRRNALRDIQDVLNESNRNNAVKSYLDFAVVPVPVPGSTSGEVVNMTLDDALKYYDLNAKSYDNDTRAAKDFRDTVFGAFGALGSALNPFSKSLNADVGDNRRSRR